MQIIVYIKRSDLLKLYDPVEKYTIPVLPTPVVSYLTDHHVPVALIIDIEEYDFPNKRLIKPKHESK